MHSPDSQPAWRQKGFLYYPLSLYLRETFGGRVQKISIDAGFSCPNVDGRIGTGGVSSAITGVSAPPGG